MFSANENLQLRQHKRRVVKYVEECIPENALELGTNVMAMQVSCKAPGCVPVETAVIIVFPPSDVELLPGLAESKGGSYKTKVLKPMAEITKEDVLEALPPSFAGGMRTIEKLGVKARDVMLAQITQIFGEEDKEGRELMAAYLQESLQEYLNNQCEPPLWGEPFPSKTVIAGDDSAPSSSKLTDKPQDLRGTETLLDESRKISVTGHGNLVIRRSSDSPSTLTSANTVPWNQQDGGTHNTETTSTAESHLIQKNVNSIQKRRNQQVAERFLNEQNTFNPLARLVEREHAAGVRQPGCPCCDPENPSNVADKWLEMQL